MFSVLEVAMKKRTIILRAFIALALVSAAGLA
jgi:hypothetical protein